VVHFNPFLVVYYHRFLHIIAELGVLLCFVGVLFTAMLAKIPVYFMYKDSIGFYPET